MIPRRLTLDPPPGPPFEGGDTTAARARPPVEVAAAETCAGALVTGVRFVGGKAPPEPPPELPVVAALERVGALAVPDLLVALVCPDAGDVVALGVF